MLRIEWDGGAGVLRIVARRFCELTTVDEFRAAFAAGEQRSARPKAGSASLLVLVDARNTSTQGQDVTAALQTAFVA